MGNFGDILPGQSLGLVLKKLNLTTKANNTRRKWQKHTKTQHSTVLIIFPLILQTITIAQILSTKGKGDTTQMTNNQEPNSSMQL